MINTPFMNLNKYEFNHLVEHFIFSGMTQELRLLLTIETPDGQNAWYLAKETIGEIGSYVFDITRARDSHNLVLKDAPNDEINYNLGFYIRFSLILSSINSITVNLPSDLIVEMVKNQDWTPLQGYSYAKKLFLSDSKTEAIIGLFPHLPRRLIEESITGILTIGDTTNRDYALKEASLKLVSCEYCELSISTAMSICSPDLKTEVLVVLCDVFTKSNNFDAALECVRLGNLRQIREVILLLPAKFLHKAISIVKSEGKINCEHILSEVSIRYAEIGDYVQSINILKQISSDNACERVLSKIIMRLPQEYLSSALEIANRFNKAEEKGKALINILPRLERGIQERVEEDALNTIGLIKEPKIRVMLLQQLKHNVCGEKKGAIDVECLSTLSKYMPVLRDVGESTHHVYKRAKYLFEICKHIDSPSSYEAFRQILSACNSITNLHYKLETIESLLPFLSMEDQKIAISLAFEYMQVSKDSWAFMNVEAFFCRILEFLPEDLFPVFLNTIVLQPLRYSEIANVIRQCPNDKRSFLLEKLITSTEDSPSDFDLIEILSSCKEFLTCDLALKAMKVARVKETHAGISKDHILPEVISVLAHILPEESIRASLILVTKERSNKATREAQIPLAMRLAELGYHREAFNLTKNMDTYYYRGWMLARIAPFLEGDLLFEAIGSLREIEPDNCKSPALASLTKRAIILGKTKECLRILQEIHDEKEIEEFLNRLPVELCNHSHFNEALHVIRSIENDTNRFCSLARILNREYILLETLPHMDKEIVRESLNVIQNSWLSLEISTKSLSSLLNRFAELGEGEEAIRLGRKIGGLIVGREHKILCYMAKNLPEKVILKTWEEAIIDNSLITRWITLANFIKFLPYEEYETVLLDFLNRMEEYFAHHLDSDLEEILRLLIPNIPHHFQMKMLQIIQLLNDLTIRVELLSLAIKSFSGEYITTSIRSEIDNLWNTIIKMSSVKNKENEDVFYEIRIHQKYRDVLSRVEVLTKLLPYCSNDTIIKMLNSIDQIADIRISIKLVIGLLPYLSELAYSSLLSKGYIILQAIKDKDEFNKAVESFSTHFDLLPHGKKHEIISIIRDYQHLTTKVITLLSIVNHLSEKESNIIMSEILQEAKLVTKNDDICFIMKSIPNIFYPRYRTALMSLIHRIDNKADRVNIMIYFCKLTYNSVDRNIIDEILKLAEEVYNDTSKGDIYDRSRVYLTMLSELVICTPNIVSTRLFTKALVFTQKISNRHTCYDYFTTLLGSWCQKAISDLSFKNAFLKNVLPNISTCKRCETILCLLPVAALVVNLGKKVAVIEMVKALQDVRRWWP